GGTLRISYFRRSSQLVDTEQAGLVTDVTGSDVTLSFLPGTWTVGTLVDCVDPNPPFDTTLRSAEITAINGQVITLSSVEGIETGMWLCLEGETVVPPIPVEAHHVLAQATTVKVLEALGDDSGMKRAEAKLK